ncbi:MAG: hypothetical protein DLM69_07470 [Candidatus Chloroheliales bacterium]|nr:MAG: hypothetical protein DLM69_07470 [Chloroflexota bacterium]
MTSTLNCFAGALRYEFRMQLRRPAVWTLILVVGVLLGILYLLPDPTDPAYVTVAERTQLFNGFLPIAYGILLADRLARERRLHTDELLASLPASVDSRLWGKYLGAVAATAIPAALVYLMEISFIAITRLDASLLPLEVPAFAAIVLPTLLFVGAFSIVCTAVLPPPLYSILFIGYWFWGNEVTPQQIPTLNCSLLTPNGLYARVGILGGDMTPTCRNSIAHISVAQAWASIGLLLGLATLAMAIGQFYLNWRAARR